MASSNRIDWRSSEMYAKEMKHARKLLNDFLDLKEEKFRSLDEYDLCKDQINNLRVEINDEWQRRELIFEDIKVMEWTKFGELCKELEVIGHFIDSAYQFANMETSEAAVQSLEYGAEKAEDLFDDKKEDYSEEMFDKVSKVVEIFWDTANDCWKRK